MRTVLGEYSNSRTSRQMLEAVISFEMNMKPADPYLVDEFFIRHGFLETLEERDDLTDEQVYRGLIYAWKRWTEINRHSSPMLHKPNETRIRSLAVRLSRIHEAVKDDTCPPENGFMDWLNTAEVMLS